jgi:hypothetical protein
MSATLNLDRPMMKCGCAAQSVCRSKGGKTFDPPIPSCVIHDCIDVADSPPNLEGRMARCAYKPHGHADRPSSLDLPFFEFRGEGSSDATEKCKCGMRKSVHDKHGGRIPAKQYAMLVKGCEGFQANGPHDFDRYYCGCHGWD